MTTTIIQTFNEVDAIRFTIERGRQQLIFCNNVPVSHITPFYTLDEFVLMINQDNLLPCGKKVFIQQDNTTPTVDPAQIVKINQLYHSIKDQNIVKPMLLDVSSGKLRPSTGDSRMRALSLLPHIQHVPAFIICNQDQTVPLSGTKITDFDSFANAAGVPNNTNFWFNFDQDHKIIWYEVDLKTNITCAGQQFAEWCKMVFANYIIKQDKNFLISREWFTEDIDWDQYVLE